MKMNKPLEAALEILTPHLRDPEPKQSLIAAKVIGLMKGYAHRWDDSKYRIDDVESVLTSDLFNPETGRKSRSFTIAGKLDVRATEIATGQRVLFDHKTTSDDIQDPVSDYWRKLVVEGQPATYFLLEHLNGEKVDRAIWNCIKRPGISPKAVAKKDAESFMRDGLYCGQKFEAEGAGAIQGRQTRDRPDVHGATGARLHSRTPGILLSAPQRSAP